MEMSKITNYEAITETSLIALNSSVQNYINKGWQPLGGVSHQFIDQAEESGHYTESMYSQAMVKYLGG